jgi:hypothetical protein
VKAKVPTSTILPIAVRTALVFCLRLTGPVAALLEVEALIAQAGIAVVAQVSTAVEASDEPVAEAMAAPPVEASAWAEAQA